MKSHQNLSISSKPATFCASYHHGTNGGRSAILKKSTAKLDSGLLGLLILCGDISSNPGSKCKHPCGICSKSVRSDQRAVQCDSCDVWYHVKCMQMNTHVYEALANSSCTWECVICGLPNFSSSLFESSTTKVQTISGLWTRIYLIKVTMNQFTQ